MAPPPAFDDTAPLDEGELLARLRLGDEQAFAAIFRNAYPRLVVTATRLLADRARGEDIAQEVLLELWRRRESLLLSGTIGGYLHQATRNRALNQLRHDRTMRRSEPNVRPPGGADDPDAGVITAELAAAVAASIAALSVPQREVFQMSRDRGLTYQEIATLLGLSVKSVEARMGRALKELRERLAPWLPDGGGW
jgi:RNA polymerase sigma-70 factor (ECF subfamily)